MIEKDFAVIKIGEKLCVKEYSTGNIFEITDDFGEYNYYEKAVYDKENETIIAAAYKDGVTEVWKVKLEWIEGAGEKAESENMEENMESEETEELSEKGEPPISCESVVLQTSGGSIYKVLEFEDRIIVYFVEGSIAAFDVETGEKNL